MDPIISKYKIVENFRKKFSGLYIRPPDPKPLSGEMKNSMFLGTYYYPRGDSAAMLNEILRRVSANKALGPDKVSDRWLRKRRNAMPYMSHLEERFNKGKPEISGLNDANLFLISKEDTPTPTINRIRPLAAFSPLFKCKEA